MTEPAPAAPPARSSGLPFVAGLASAVLLGGVFYGGVRYGEHRADERILSNIADIQEAIGGPATDASAEQPRTSFGNGVWDVREGSMAPGLYRSSGGADCTWIRYGGDGAVVEQGTGQLSPTEVTVRDGDLSFLSEDCAEWVLVEN